MRGEREAEVGLRESRDSATENVCNLRSESGLEVDREKSCFVEI